jgi:hypothetical protein
VGLLIETIADEPEVNLAQLTRVHTLLSAAVASVTIEAWRDRAEQDELTSLRNRAGWESDARNFRVERPLAYASIDLDGLKKVNDGPGAIRPVMRFCVVLGGACRSLLRLWVGLLIDMAATSFRQSSKPM